jgi:multiple sugar transport system substrate-binding protein
MKKLLVVLVSCFVIAALFLTSCSKKDDGKTTLIYWDCMPPSEPVGIGIKNLIAEFEKLNPKVTVKHLYITWAEFDTKLQTAISGSMPPDVVMVDRFRVGSYASHGALSELDSFVK